MVERSSTKKPMMFFDDARQLGLPKNEAVSISSVGVLVHTGDLSPKGDPSFLFVERVDHPEDAGWGIPAGRTEPFDLHPKHSGSRELKQETGLVAGADSLLPFAFIDKLNDEKIIRVVYSFKCNMKKLLTLGNFSSRSNILITPASEPISDEIRRLAIIPRLELFDSGSKVITNYIKWDVMHWIKARLESLRVI